jgi:hypothetical protein
MEERLKASEELAAAYGGRLEAASTAIADLTSGVSALFERAGCGGSPAVRAALGGGDAAAIGGGGTCGGVTATSLLPAVSVVEQRVAEALRVYAGALQVRATFASG